MKQGFVVPCAAALLAVPQVATAQDRALCDRLEAFAAAQWREPDPAPRQWVEFHWGIEADTANRWSWGCRDAGDAASGEFCDWLMDNTAQGFHTGLPVGVLECMGDEFPDQPASEWQLDEGEFRRQTGDGTWLVLEFTSRGLQRGESAVRISFDADDRRLEPAVLPPMQAFADTAE
jgi:hypothetical protein